MSAFETLFGRTYNSVGNSNSDFIIKTRGQVKVQWGNRFIDIIKNGKLNVDSEVIKKVSTADRISSDGIYYVEDSGKVILKVGGVVIDLSDDGSGTFVSYITKQEPTVEQRDMALSNIGLKFVSEEAATEAGIKSGVVFLEDSQKWFLVKDGVITEYPVELPNPYTNQIVVKKGGNARGAVIIEGGGENNSLIVGGSSGTAIYQNGSSGYINSEASLIIAVNKEDAVTITPEGLATTSVTASMITSEDGSFKLYSKNGESTLEVDNIIESGAVLGTVEVTFEDFSDLLSSKRLVAGSTYKITDFQNEWELTESNNIVTEDSTYERDILDEAEQVIGKETVTVVKNVRPLIVIADIDSSIKSIYFEDNPEWLIEYNPEYTDEITISTTAEDGTVSTATVSAKGRITKLTDEKGNSCNYDFKHLKFKINEDGIDKWVYTFRDGENDLSLSETCVGNTLTVSNYKIQSETITVKEEGNVATLSGTLTNNNFGIIDSNFNFSGTANKVNVAGTLNNVVFKQDSSINDIVIRSLTNVTFNESVSKTTFHSDINDVNFDTTIYSLLYDNEKVKDIYYSGGVVSVICIPDIIPGASNASNIPAGSILMHNNASNIPAGWAICDGNNGTPDLTNSFIKSGITVGETGEFTPATPSESSETPIKYYSLVFIMKLA